MVSEINLVDKSTNGKLQFTIIYDWLLLPHHVVIWPHKAKRISLRTREYLVLITEQEVSHTENSVNKIFIVWRKQEQFNSLNVTGLY